MQGQLLTAPLRHPYAVYHAAFNHDGSLLATTAIQTAHVWDTATGREVCAPIANGDAVAFSPDGKRLLVAGSHGARLLDTGTWQPAVPALPQTNLIRCVGFSRDGTKMVTAGDDKMARVWDVRTGFAAGEPLRHDYVVFNAHFS